MPLDSIPQEDKKKTPHPSISTMTGGIVKAYALLRATSELWRTSIKRLEDWSN